MKISGNEQRFLWRRAFLGRVKEMGHSPEEIYTTMGRLHSRTLLFALLLFAFFALPAAAQPADTSARIIPTHWTCNVGAGEIHGTPSPTSSPTASVQLVRTDDVGFIPVCQDMPPAGEVLLDFLVVGFPVGTNPNMQASAFVGPSCTGAESPLSPNSCTVSYGPPVSPIFLVPPPVAQMSDEEFRRYAQHRARIERGGKHLVLSVEAFQDPS